MLSTMAIHVKVSSRFQIAVPAEARRKLHIKQGDQLLVEVLGGSLLLLPEPHDYAERLRGLHSEVWEGVDTDEYIRQEREAWRE